MRILIILGITYLLVNTSVYATHNFIYKIISVNNNLTCRQFAVLDMLLIVKFFGAFFWANMADRTQMHSYILTTGLLGSSVMLSMFRFASGTFKPDGLNFWTYFYFVLYTFFLASVYAVIDSYCLQILDNNKKKNKIWGLIKLCGSVGHSFGPLLVAAFGKDTRDKTDNEFPVILSILSALVGGIFIMVAFPMLAKEKIIKEVKKKEPLTRRIQKNFTNMKNIFSVSLLFLLLCVTAQGIHRNIVAAYLELYTTECHVSRKKLSMAFAFRFIPEASLLFTIAHIDKAIGITWMITIGTLFGIFRPMLYSCINPNNLSPRVMVFLVFLSELSKGVFCGLFNYSCTKFVNALSTSKTKAFAQGCFNGCYAGLAPCLGGLIAYLLIESSTLKIGGSNARFLFLFSSLIGLVGVIPMILLIMKNRKDARIRRNNIIGMHDIDHGDMIGQKIWK